MLRGVSGCKIIIILYGSSISEFTVCGRGAYVVFDAESHGIGTLVPFEAHRGLISNEWDRLILNRINSLTNGASRNPNVVTITDLCVNRTEACTARLLGYIHCYFSDL